MVLNGGIESRKVPVNSQQEIKETNARKLFSLITENGNISRSQLVEKSGLSPATVSVLTDDMIKNGFIRQTGAGESSTAGRKPINLDIVADKLMIPAFSFKANGILCVIYNLKLQPVEELYQPYGKEFPQEKGFLYNRRFVSAKVVADIFINILSRSKCFDKEKADAITVSFPGNYLKKDKRLHSSLFGWQVSDEFINILEEKYGIPVFVGDETLFQASCDRANIGRHEENALYIYTGHGVGSAIALGGEFYYGKKTAAGEIGHVTVDIHGKQCSCGSRGCLECYARTEAILNSVLEQIHAGRNSSVLKFADYDERRIHMDTLGKALADGDEVVTEVIQDVIEKIVFATSGMLCALGSMNVYIGGDVMELGPKFMEMLRKTAKTIGYRYVLDATEFDWAETSRNSECKGGVIEYLSSYLTLTC